MKNEVRTLRLDYLEGSDPAVRDTIKKWIEQYLLPSLPETACVISIDGMDGTGKSTISQLVSELTGMVHLELDNYLTKNAGVYFEGLDIDRLKRDILAHRTARNVILIEGCLCGKVLKEIDIIPDFKIYIVATRVTPGVDLEAYKEPDLFDETISTEELFKQIQHTKSAAARLREMDSEFSIGDPSFSKLDEELLKYHRKCWPKSAADLIIHIVDRR